MDLITLKTRIKSWEHAFTKQHSRAPSRLDVKQNAEILALYKSYKALKSKASKPAIANPSQIDNIKNLLDEPIEDDQFLISTNTELGPTPQAEGKILSIFDIKMTPPESSPLKHKLAPNTEFKTVEFKTPTKPKKIPTTPSKATPKSNFMQKILAAKSSPVASASQETPMYLKRNIDKFEIRSPAFSSPSTGSPTKISTPTKFSGSRVAPSSPTRSSTPVRSTQRSSAPVSQLPLFNTPQTPTSKQQPNFQVSPSPFKSFSETRKRLLDIYEDHKSITIDEDIEITDEEEVEQEQVENKVYRKRSKTQKRSTRRFKIRPNIFSADDDFRNKDLHKMMEQINENEEKTLDNMQDKEEEEEEEEEEEKEKEVTDHNTKPTGRKRNPISNNFKRMKIHYKKNKRWGGRR